MEIKTAIEVMAYGDYDIRYTTCIMVSPHVRNVKDIFKSYCDSKGLSPDGRGLPSNMLSDTTDDFINYLQKEGFAPLKTNAIIFTD